MTFPAIELKFSRILRTPDRTRVLARLYRVDDGGLDGEGRQLYNRTLLKEHEFKLDASWDAQRILSVAIPKLQEMAQERGYNLTPDRLICSL